MHTIFGYSVGGSTEEITNSTVNNEEFNMLTSAINTTIETEPTDAVEIEIQENMAKLCSTIIIFVKNGTKAFEDNWQNPELE